MLKGGSSQVILFSMIVLLCLNYIVLDSSFATKGSYPGDNGKIVFTDNDPDSPYDREIFVMDNDGSNVQRLTFNDVNDREPCWSPDGTKITFHRGDYPDIEIWVMDADGSNQRQLTTPPDTIYDLEPAWSPDGEKIAFFRSSGSTIYVIDANGPAGVGTILISGPAASPSWSPDGTEIVYNAPGGLYVADASTGAFKRALGEGYDPCWSPDGTKIVFGHNEAIWVMDAGDGSNRQQLSDPPQQPIDYEDEDPNWSPDGEIIVFDREPDSIWIMNADGSMEFDLTPSLPNAEQPDYQMITLAPVGGVTSPINKLEILTPYLALVGLIIAVSTVYVIKKRKD
jgi:dipeptidyl aminopeptidase/acylaminoacyl peptidase